MNQNTKRYIGLLLLGNQNCNYLILNFKFMYLKFPKIAVCKSVTSLSCYSNFQGSGSLTFASLTCATGTPGCYVI